MEPSPSFALTSASASPNTNLDQQPRLTVKQLEQLEVEEKVAEIYHLLNGVSSHTQSLMSELWRDNHVEFLTRGLKQLGPSYHVLDANRPWLCYQIFHSVALLGGPLDPELENNVVDFLSCCEEKDGGYGGRPGQLPHLATTYAAVNTLFKLGSENALSSINRDNLYKFLLRMKDSSGAFRMHNASEIDVCASYIVISVYNRYPYIALVDELVAGSQVQLSS